MQDEELNSCVFILCRMSIIPYGKKKRCMHGNIEFICLDCDSTFVKRKKVASLCCHGKQKSFCKDCGGSVFCKHEKQRRYCIECDGSGICKHMRQRSSCKECRGSA